MIPSRPARVVPLTLHVARPVPPAIPASVIAAGTPPDRRSPASNVQRPTRPCRLPPHRGPRRANDRPPSGTSTPPVQPSRPPCIHRRPAMHGVRRGARSGRTASDEAALRARAAGEAARVRAALAARARGDFSDETLAAAAVAAVSNPDEYSLWAQRREALLRAHPDARPQAWRDEVALSARALRVHPKAYPAWQHRLWLLDVAWRAAGVPEDEWADAVGKEMALCEAMLRADARNFHGWAHRLRVRAVAARGVVGELDFVTGKVLEDFANYSAWHHRAAVLPKVRKAFVGEELALVREAFYTEPDVQSVWFYHRWLLAGAPAKGGKCAVERRLCEEELDACRALLEIEPEARWALHAVAHLLRMLDREDEAVPVYRKLVTLDPMRRGYYRDQIAACSGAGDSPPPEHAAISTGELTGAPGKLLREDQTSI